MTVTSKTRLNFSIPKAHYGELHKPTKYYVRGKYHPAHKQ